MRRLVLTFLGTGDYSKTNYYVWDTGHTYYTPFPVVAYLKLMDWKNDELELRVFVTKKAKEKNLNYLQCELRKLETFGIKVKDKVVEINEGKSLEEIWKNFEKLVHAVRDGFAGDYGTIVLDITYSLRSIPLLSMVAVLYAKALEGKTKKDFRIIYGAYEAGDKKSNITPIFDLSHYYELMELSLAVDEFVNYGTAERFGELAKTLDESSEKQLAKKLKQLLEYVYVLRCPSIESFSLKDIDWDAFNDEKGRKLFTSELLKRIRDEVKDFIEESSVVSRWKKALWAVRWCAEHGLYPQGYTILRELLLNYACSILVPNEPYEENFGVRKRVEGILSVANKQKSRREAKNLLMKEMKSLEEKDAEKIIKVYSLLYRGKNSVSKFRNDIDHCAFGEQKQYRKSPEELKKSLSNLLSKAEKIILEGES